MELLQNTYQTKCNIKTHSMTPPSIPWIYSEIIKFFFSNLSQRQNLFQVLIYYNIFFSLRGNLQITFPNFFVLLGLFLKRQDFPTIFIQCMYAHIYLHVCEEGEVVLEEGFLSILQKEEYPSYPSNREPSLPYAKAIHLLLIHFPKVLSTGSQSPSQ